MQRKVLIASSLLIASSSVFCFSKSVMAETNSNDIAKTIAKSDNAAMREYHKGLVDQAIASESAGIREAVEQARHLLSDTEQVDVELATAEAAESPTPSICIKVFEGAHIKSRVWQNAINNYAFFLQLKGEHEKAIPIFKKIIEVNPERSVAYLNLGDSLFASGEKKEALVAYKNYEQHLDKHTIIPERVIARLQENL